MTDERAIVVVNSNKLDIYSSLRWKNLIEVALDEAGPTGIIVDLGQVSHLDSTGIATLVGLDGRALDQGKRLYLRNISPSVMGLFDRIGVNTIFQTFDPSFGSQASRA